MDLDDIRGYLPSHPWRQEFHQRRAHRACQQVPGVRGHQRVQQHQAHPEGGQKTFSHLHAEKH